MRRAPLAFVAVPLVTMGLLGEACVEGKTPDCSDPNVQCGPDLDGSPGADAGGDALADVFDAESASDADAEGDAPADAPDGG